MKSNLVYNPNIFENRILVESEDLKVKLVVSGVSDNINKECNITITGLPLFNKGYTYVNGINHFGKNILFYKKASANTIIGQIQNSRNKVPRLTPYIVAINLTGPRFETEHYAEIIAKRFERKNNTNISGVLFVEYLLDDIGDVVVQMHYISNPNAVVNLDWIEGLFNKSIKLSIHSRY